MGKAATNPAYRRYMRRIIPLTITYLLGILMANGLVPDRSGLSAVAIVVALLPGLCAVGWIWAMARLLIELDDEYLRMLEVRKFLIATAALLALTSIWGLLEAYTSVPRLPVFFVFPIWCLGLVLGQIGNRITMKDGNCG
jgi:hypothetical protein